MKNIKEKLIQEGFKLTKPRLVVLQILKNNTNPLSAKVIFNKTSKKIDLTSVYRTLELFKKLGIIQKETNEDEKKYYLSPSPHHHITCEKCGHTECIPCEHIFKNIKNFKKITHQLTLTGLCKKCYS